MFYWLYISEFQRLIIKRVTHVRQSLKCKVSKTNCEQWERGFITSLIYRPDKSSACLRLSSLKLATGMLSVLELGHRSWILESGDRDDCGERENRSDLKQVGIG